MKCFFLAGSQLTGKTVFLCFLYHIVYSLFNDRLIEIEHDYSPFLLLELLHIDNGWEKRSVEKKMKRSKNKNMLGAAS